MREDQGIERGAQTSADTRLQWVKPEVRRMSAGDAESGFPGSQTDAPFVTTS
ncbi:MAG: hypothetical protein JWP15_60 [Alphaproteobacteria bacterium]|nr:hypothetical protein [Alphaproteobacteria bacterium]